MTNTGSGSFSSSFAFIIEDNLLAYRELVLRYSQAPVTIPKGTVISSGGTPSPYTGMSVSWDTTNGTPSL